MSLRAVGEAPTWEAGIVSACGLAMTLEETMVFSKVEADPYAWPYEGGVNYEAVLKMIKMQGGVFGSVAYSEQFLAALDRC